MSNSEVWQDVALHKRRPDEYGEANSILLEAIGAAIDKDLAAAADDPANLLNTMRQAIQDNLDTLE